MRIKDLPAATTLGSDFYIATDDATAGTRKASFSQMISMQTAATGSSSTDYLLIYDPFDDAVYKTTKSLFLAGVNGDIANLRQYEVTISGLSSLPKTVSDADINGDLDVDCFILSNPAAMVSAWTVTTTTGSLTISGTIATGLTTDVYIKLSKPYKTIT